MLLYKHNKQVGEIDFLPLTCFLCRKIVKCVKFPCSYMKNMLEKIVLICNLAETVLSFGRNVNFVS